MLSWIDRLLQQQKKSWVDRLLLSSTLAKSKFYLKLSLLKLYI